MIILPLQVQTSNRLQE